MCIRDRSNTFSKDEIKDLKAQPFTKGVGAFTPSLFKVSAGLGMQEAGIRLSTEMFFESVPDEYVDVSLEKWHFDEDARVIPIILSLIHIYILPTEIGRKQRFFSRWESMPRNSEIIITI